jgi:hypothetical protein
VSVNRKRFVRELMGDFRELVGELVFAKRPVASPEVISLLVVVLVLAAAFITILVMVFFRK